MKTLHSIRVIAVLFAAAVAVFLPVSSTAAADADAAGNLIANGSFERLSAEQWPDGFGTWVGAGEPVITVDRAVARTGDQSVAITGDGSARANVNTSVSVVGGSSYRLTVWFRVTDRVSPDAVVVRLQAFDDQTKVPWDMDWVLDRSRVSAHVAAENFALSPQETTLSVETWYPLTVSFTLPPDVTRLGIDLFNWFGNGTIWYDDLRLERLNNEAETLTREGVGIRMTEPELYLALDLGRPELADVAKAVEAGDLIAARRAFASYLRQRQHPAWYFDWRDPLGSGSVGERDTRIANDALRQRFTVIGIAHEFPGDIDWTYNPTTQPGSPYAPNNEWTWQFNRHHFWVSMGRMYHATGDEVYAETFVKQMTDWVTKNPVPDWPDQRAFSTWRTIEAGIRMQNWSNVFMYFLSSPRFTDEALVTMVRSMVEHARYLMAHPTAGNWLTMEMNGLYHVGVLFPEFREAVSWRQFAVDRLRQELDIQVYPDGVQYELTPHYHNVALHNFLGIVRLARLNGYELPTGYIDKLEKMFELNLYMMTPTGSLPPFNDSGREDPVSQLRTGYEFFPHRRDFLWGASDGMVGNPPQQTSYAFPYAGYVIQRSGWDKDARYLAFDVGPFGYEHQHEDKLNFVLTAYRREFIVEGGIYAYDSSHWRTYVLGPYAHNVAFVDGMGQRRRGNRATYVTDTPVDFVWEVTQQYDFAQGYYGGEGEGFGPAGERIATHQRSILFVKEGKDRDFWVVVDTFIPNDGREHLYESIFHINAPDVTVDPATRAVRTNYERGANLGIFPLISENQLPVQVVQGQVEPSVEGWIAVDSNEVKPVPTPRFGVEGTGVQHMLYVFYPVSEGSVPDISVAPWQGALDREHGVGARIEFPDGRTYRVFVPTDREAELRLDGITISGPVFVERVE